MKILLCVKALGQHPGFWTYQFLDDRTITIIFCSTRREEFTGEIWRWSKLV